MDRKGASKGICLFRSEKNRQIARPRNNKAFLRYVCARFPKSDRWFSRGDSALSGNTFLPSLVPLQEVHCQTKESGVRMKVYRQSSRFARTVQTTLSSSTLVTLPTIQHQRQEGRSISVLSEIHLRLHFIRTLWLILRASAPASAGTLHRVVRDTYGPPHLSKRENLCTKH